MSTKYFDEAVSKAHLAPHLVLVGLDERRIRVNGFNLLSEKITDKEKEEDRLNSNAESASEWDIAEPVIDDLKSS